MMGNFSIIIGLLLLASTALLQDAPCSDTSLFTFNNETKREYSLDANLCLKTKCLCGEQCQSSYCNQWKECDIPDN